MGETSMTTLREMAEAEKRDTLAKAASEMAAHVENYNAIAAEFEGTLQRLAQHVYDAYVRCGDQGLRVGNSGTGRVWYHSPLAAVFEDAIGDPVFVPRMKMPNLVTVVSVGSEGP